MQTTLEPSPLIALLDGSLAELDITPAAHEMAVGRYHHLGDWLIVHGIGSPRVYPQGSFRLGTVVRPGVDGEYDIDLVFLREVARGSITQAELKSQAGALLQTYLDECGHEIGNPKLEEKGRCWCLTWVDNQVHLDILPVIPDDSEGADDDGILLTDRDLYCWQYSNPIGYADWFKSRMADVFAARRAALAVTLEKSAEEVPEWLIRTPLQRAVQVLKRHRDLFFAERSDAAPSSILITTLAAHAYSGQLDTLAAVRHIADRLTDGIEDRDGVLWVPNPAHELENFADKWRSDETRRAGFVEWHASLRHELSGWDDEPGLDRLAGRLSRSLGDEPVRQAAAQFAIDLRDSVAAGASSVSAAGQIGRSTSGTPVKPHTFHGE